jgi:hypothetical protein
MGHPAQIEINEKPGAQLVQRYIVKFVSSHAFSV